MRRRMRCLGFFTLLALQACVLDGRESELAIGSNQRGFATVSIASQWQSNHMELSFESVPPGDYYLFALAGLTDLPSYPRREEVAALAIGASDLPQPCSSTSELWSCEQVPGVGVLVDQVTLDGAQALVLKHAYGGGGFDEEDLGDILIFYSFVSMPAVELKGRVHVESWNRNAGAESAVIEQVF